MKEAQRLGASVPRCVVGRGEALVTPRRRLADVRASARRYRTRIRFPDRDRPPSAAAAPEAAVAPAYAALQLRRGKLSGGIRSTTRGRPPVMSLVLVVSRGIFASTSPASTLLPSCTITFYPGCFAHRPRFSRTLTMGAPRIDEDGRLPERRAVEVIRRHRLFRGVVQKIQHVGTTSTTKLVVICIATPGTHSWRSHRPRRRSATR
jgi:hypothetical protein